MNLSQISKSLKIHPEYYEPRKRRSGTKKAADGSLFLRTDSVDL